MSLINKEISDFSVMSYHKGAFEKVTKADVLGKVEPVLLLSGGFHLCMPHRAGGSAEPVRRLLRGWL